MSDFSWLDEISRGRKESKLRREMILVLFRLKLYKLDWRYLGNFK